MEARDTRRWLALGALALSTLIIGLDMTVLTVALPTLAVDLHASTSALQWFNTAYTLALTAVLLPAGVLGDRYGRRKFLLMALVLFGGASIWCAFATSAGELIAARAVLGVAAAVVIPLGMAVLPTLFPDEAERTRAMTIWVTAMGLGMPLGPLIGGYLLNNFWWGSAFLVSVPFVAIGAAAVAMLVPEARSGTASGVDVAGVALSSAGLVGLTYGFIRIGEQGWGNGFAWAVICAAVVVLAVFFRWQRRLTERNGHPLIDLSLFGSAGFAWGVVVLTLANFGLFGMFFATPQYFQAVLGADSLGSGLRLLPMIAGMVVGSRLVGRIMDRAGARGAVMVGFGLFAIGLGAAALTTIDSGYGFAATWLVTIGLGMGLVMPAAMSMAVGALAPERAGSGSALLQAVRQAGGTIGVAVLGTVEATRYHTRLGELNIEPIRDGVSAGVRIARKAGDPAMIAHVQSAFLSGMSLMLGICAAISVVSLALVAVFGPRRVRSADPNATAAESAYAG